MYFAVMRSDIPCGLVCVRFYCLLSIAFTFSCRPSFNKILSSNTNCERISKTPEGLFWKDPRQVSTAGDHALSAIKKDCDFLDTVNTVGVGLLRIGNLKTVDIERGELASKFALVVGAKRKHRPVLTTVFRIAVDSLDAIAQPGENYYAFSVHSLAYRLLRSEKFDEPQLADAVEVSAYRDLFDYSPGVVCALISYSNLLQNDVIFNVTDDDICSYIYGWQSLISKVLADPVGVFGE